MRNDWTHAAEKDPRGVVPLIEVSACDGIESSRISKLLESESQNVNAIDLAENHTDPAAPGYEPGCPEHPQRSSAGSVPGGRSAMNEGSALAVLGGGFLPSSRVGAAHPSSVHGDGGVAGPKVTPAISNAAVCPALVFQGCHALELVVAEM